MCNKASVTADIGCDHGKLGYALLKSGKTQKLIATDISAACLLKAEKLIAPEFGAAEFRAGNGLEVIYPGDNVQQIVIAGMGGLEIVSILSEHNPQQALPVTPFAKGGIATRKPAFILQPQNKIVELRRFLNQNNYKIIADLIVKEGNKYYHIVKIIHGKQALTELQLLFGADTAAYLTADYKEWLAKLETKLKFVLSKTNDKTKKKQISRCLKLLQKIPLYEGVDAPKAQTG